MIGGLIREIKIPVQELRLKTLGGLIREGGGGLICGTLRYYSLSVEKQVPWSGVLMIFVHSFGETRS